MGSIDAIYNLFSGFGQLVIDSGLDIAHLFLDFVTGSLGGN